MSTIRSYKIVPNDPNAKLEPGEFTAISATVRPNNSIQNGSHNFITTMTHQNGTTRSTPASVSVRIKELASGTIKVKYMNGDTIIKTDTITKQHGASYTIDTTTFTKDGKIYEVETVEGDRTGTIEGLTNKDIVVHVKEKEVTFDLPTTGTVDGVITLIGLSGTLVVTKHRKMRKDSE